MLSKCANPVCSKTFLYLSEGKLFRLEVPVSEYAGIELSGNGRAASGRRSHHEYFWLCQSCSQTFQVVCEPDAGVRTIPLRQYKAAS